MKISIWRQWASNHSNDFVVVGEFATPEAATAAAEKLHEMLTLIAQFREGYADEEPTGPEVQLAEEYQLHWEKSLSWLSLGPHLAINALDGYLAVHRNRVFVTSGPAEPWLGPTPLDQLMGKLADTVLVEKEMGDYEILVNLTCLAPGETTAKKLYDQAHAYLQAVAAGKELNTPIPWITYAHGERHPQAEQFQAAHVHQLRAERELAQLTEEIHHLMTTTDADAAESMANLHDRYKDTFAAIAGYPDHAELFAAWKNTWLSAGTVTRTETTLSFHNLELSFHLGTGLRAITAWLSDHGCSNIEIELSTQNESAESG